MVKQKAESDSIIFRLSLLGWTQEQIAQHVGLEQPAIAKRLFQIPDVVKGIKRQLEAGDTMEQVALSLKIDVPFAWASLQIEANLRSDSKP